MKIPKRFKLFGQTITVEYKDKLVDKEDCVGRAIYRENKILLQKDNHSIGRTKEQIGQAFLHELMHFIMYLSNEEELRNNEKFIDITASLLHQFIITQEGELK